MTADEVRSYYGRPILKPPEWTWEVPWYLFVGGLAGVSSALSGVAGLAGRRTLQDRTRLLGSAGAVVGPALLISDLGRPQRFLNMLRVFKPTSAMSVGSWILAAYSAAAGGAGLLAMAGRFPRLRVLADCVAAALGLPLATYTAVLVADTSVPAWHEAREQLPFVFLGSAVASAGAAAALLTPADEAGVGDVLAVGGVAAELAAAETMHRHLGALGSVYREGRAGHYQRLATGLSAAGALAVVAG
ncbi:MAG: polysulfide reductase, partial [Nitriliruptorales bacterium]|nr:polysulfide reductase [Nitriliruptorales bacterium]